MEQFLIDSFANGVTIFKPEGYHMVGDETLNLSPDDNILELVKYGVKTHVLDKMMMFDCNKISNINSSEVTICIPAFTKLTGDKLKERKEKEFLKIVESTFNDLSNSKNRNLSNSPIIEGIYKLTLQVFNKNGTSAKGRLLIISDLEQNTNLISFYKNGIPVYKDWLSTSESKAWTVSMPSVKFTSIVIQRAQKNPKVNLEKLRDFWLDYAGNNFQKCGFIGLNQAAVELKYECN